MMNRRSIGTTIVGVAALLLLSLPAACTRQPSYPEAPQSGMHIVVNAADIQPDAPVFFTYRYRGRNVNFFVLRTGGKLLSFFDACASCYPHKRGYGFNDGAVTCRHCNIRFPLHKLEKGLGGCYPIRLEGRTENGNYIIPLSALEAEAGKF